MSFETVEYEIDGRVAQITMSRPQVLNALNDLMREELSMAFEKARADGQVRVVILTGKGRAFSAGADLKDVYDRPSSAEGWRDRYTDQLSKLIDLWRYPKPVIAAVNGFALGEGCDLALVADITIVSEEAKLGWPEVRMPGMEMLLLAPWLIGMKKAKELLFTGDMLDGEEAARFGLVNRVVSEERLIEESSALARRIAKVPPASTRRNKLAVSQAFEIMGIVSSWWFNHELALDSAWDRELNREERDSLVRQKGLKAYLDARDAPFEE